MAYQQAMREELITGVEQLVQRKVIAFLASNSINPDYSIENFVLAPEADGGCGELGATARARQGGAEDPSPACREP